MNTPHRHCLKISKTLEQIGKIDFIMHTQIPDSLDSKHLHIVIITSLCAGVGYFDFAIFIYLSDLFSLIFFGHTADTFAHQAQTFTLFAAGYFARPLGGLVLGRVGDIYGRKVALRASVFGVMIFTLLLAILPTHHTLGAAAPILLIIARLAQGMAMGGILPSAWVFTAEHLPSKNIGIGCGAICASCVLSLLLLVCSISILENHLSSTQMLDYGWRILFVIGGMVALLAFFLTKKLDETPIFHTLTSNKDHLDSYIDGISLGEKSSYTTGKPAKKTFVSLTAFIKILKKLLFGQTLGFITASLMSCIIASLLIFIPTLLAPLLANNFLISEDVLYFGGFISLLFMMFGAIFFGFLVDRLDAGRTLFFGGIFLIVQVLIFFLYLQDGSELILTFLALLGFATGLVAAFPTIMLRLFSARIRMTGVGLSYNLITALIGGILPFLLGYASFYYWFAPALYLAFIGILTIFISFFVYYIPRSERDLSR